MPEVRYRVLVTKDGRAEGEPVEVESRASAYQLAEVRLHDERAHGLYDAIAEQRREAVRSLRLKGHSGPLPDGTTITVEQVEGGRNE